MPRRFEKLWLTQRFFKNLNKKYSGNPTIDRKVANVLNSFLCDLDFVTRKKVQGNNTHKIFRTNLTGDDRLFDLPVDINSETLVINIGGHDAYKWAETYTGNPLDELSLGKKQEAKKEKVSAGENPRTFSLPWKNFKAVPGTYGEFLRKKDIARHGLDSDIIDNILATHTSTSLKDLSGLDRDTAEMIEASYLNKLPALKTSLPVPTVEAPKPIPIAKETLPSFLRVELSKYLAQVSEQQMKLIQSPHGRLTIVKGAAGTGKTIIGLRRVEYLATSEMFVNKILFICFNQVLESVAKQMLSDIFSVPISSKGIETNRIYRWMGKIKKDMAIKQHYKTLDNKRSQTLLIDIIENNAAPPGSNQNLKNTVYLIDEFKEILYGKNIRSLDEYLTIKRLGRVIPLVKMER